MFDNELSKKCKNGICEGFFKKSILKWVLLHFSLISLSRVSVILLKTGDNYIRWLILGVKPPVSLAARLADPLQRQVECGGNVIMNVEPSGKGPARALETWGEGGGRNV